MKIGIFGAGAIGSYLAVRLVQAGADVTLIARGSQLEAIREHGVTLIAGSERATVHPFVTSDADRAGVQDYVFIALKAHALPGAASEIAKLLGPDTALITAMNGIPYWYFYGDTSRYRDRIVESVDPGGGLWRTLPPRHAIGAVLYPWAEVVAPGVVDQSTSSKFILGEPNGEISARVTKLAEIMRAGQLDAPVTSNIRDELWMKLWGNLSMNPLSALTSATIDRLCFEPGLRAVACAMMEEAQAIAEALGVRFTIDVRKRIEIAGAAGARKTSMLQDFERGRPLEIEALLGAVVELGTLVGCELPLCRTILSLSRERARNLPTP